MTNDLCFALNEASNRNSSFAVAEVDKGHNSSFFSIKVLLSKKTILQCNCSAFVNYSETFQACNFTCIEKTLALYVAAVGGNRHD